MSLTTEELERIIRTRKWCNCPNCEKVNKDGGGLNLMVQQKLAEDNTCEGNEKMPKKRRSKKKRMHYKKMYYGLLGTLLTQHKPRRRKTRKKRNMDQFMEEDNEK